MGAFFEWIMSWGLVDWTWPKFIIALILCIAAGFMVAALQDKRKRRKDSDTP
jgi:uncharacterized membrane-anchored protein YhcB (DUF1043 family)